MYRKIKPFADFVAAAALLLLTFPVMLLLALILSAWYKGNPLFMQERVGKDGKSFYLLKFKTIFDPPGDRHTLMPAENGLTLFCRFLRDTSLDELPQLINVLKGDMALVGPRPLIGNELAMCTPLQLARHTVLPGITGWAQVNGRNSLSPDEKFKLDLWYVDHLSFFVDIKILLVTIYKVIIRDGIQPREEGATTYDTSSGIEMNGKGAT